MTTLDYQAMVDSLVALHVPREKAEARARELCPPPPPDPAQLAAAERDARIREKEEQAAVTKLLREHGFTVRSTSQARASKIALGFPDLFCTHTTRPIAFFFETKRQVGGIVSEAQQAFGDDCRRCGVGWYTGDRHAARELLQELGLPLNPLPS